MRLRSPRRHAVRVAALRWGLASALLLATAFHGGVTTARAAEPASSSGLVTIGELPTGPGLTSLTPGGIAAIDAAKRRLYYLAEPDGSTHLVTYDLRPAVPTLISSKVVASPALGGYQSPYVASLDSKRGLLYVLHGGLVAGEFSVVEVISLATGHIIRSIALTTVVPHFYAYGLLFSARDDRLYLVGDLSGTFLMGQAGPTFGEKVAGPVSAVVALTTSGSLAWARPVPECLSVLNTLAVGALIAQSSHQERLSFACVTSSTVGMPTTPGESGVVDLDIDPKASSSAAALHFGVRFHPVSGSYFNGAASGIAAYDHTSDRFFLQSLATTTPGAWVLDERLGAWTGFISAVDSNDNYLGLNEGSGHYYIGSSGDGGTSKGHYLIVADGRATPVPSGRLSTALTPAGFMFADPESNRLFMPTGYDTKRHILVVADQTPAALEPPPLDYDALTSSAPEGPGTFTSFSGTVSGFAESIQQIGGIGGLRSGVSLTNLAPPPLAPGSRGILLSRAPGVDIREVGASAAAQAATEDSNTQSEHQDQTTAHPQIPAWPYPGTDCLNSSGAAVNRVQPGPLGSAKVVCDVSHGTASATARMGEASAGPVSTGPTEFTTSTRRDPQLGAVTTAESRANGLAVVVPGGATLRIGTAVTTVSTTAHGHSGTAGTHWHRDIRGVSVSQSGAELLPTSACASDVLIDSKGRDVSDTCQALADKVNAVLRTRLAMQVDLPEVVATPKGAFATVRQSTGTYLQERTVNDQGVVFPLDSLTRRASPALELEVFNDSTERSRTVVQLAAVEASSIYPISTEPAFSPPLQGKPVSEPVRSVITQPRLLPPPARPAGPPDVVGPDQAGPEATARSATVQGLSLLARSFGESVLAALTFLLFASAAESSRRHRQLLRTIALEKETSHL